MEGSNEGGTPKSAGGFLKRIDSLKETQPTPVTPETKNFLGKVDQVVSQKKSTETEATYQGKPLEQRNNQPIIGADTPFGEESK